ncbi:MAG: caspase family protein [Saprospiraceae bacterium]
MKSMVCICAAFLLLSASNPSGKKALIVAVSHYGPQTGWDTINAQNDVPLLLEAAEQLGIPRSQIRVLRDGEATHQGIIAALQEIKTTARPGDFIYFHFSGHGQQRQDYDGDEADGFDEALVPYDSPMRFSAAYQGERLITDDLIYQWTRDLRPSLGKQGGIFITLDACHSGTAARGGGTYRGATFPMAEREYWRKIRTESVLTLENTWEEPCLEAETWAPCVVFSATQGNQLNWEYVQPGSGEPCGPLSYALNKCLTSSRPASFRALFEQVKKEMSRIAPYQQPQAEGDLFTGLDKILSDHQD